MSTAKPGTSAYRSPAGAGIPVETIVVRRPRRLEAFLCAVPFVLTFNDCLMKTIFGVPFTAVGDSGDFCGNSVRHLANANVVLHMEQASLVTFCVAVIGAAYALASLHGMKTTIHVDRAARVLRIVEGNKEQTITFVEHPILVLRDDVYTLRAGARPPILVGSKRASRSALARLRTALATLDPIEG